MMPPVRSKQASVIAGRVSRIAVTTLAAAACVLGSVSCSAPSKGALVLAISTDMQTPKDIDVVSVFVSTNSVPKYDYLGRVTPDGKVTLPATMPVVEPDDPSAKVRIRVVAFKQADAKVMRDVVTTVPHQRTALLRLPLDFLDVGSVKSGGIPPKFFPDGKSVVDGLTEWDPTNPTDVVPKCDFLAGLTMVNGVCAEVGVDSSKLPDYSEPAVFGEGGLQNGVPASCFDAARCFAGATPVVGLTTAASGACSFPLPAGAQPSTFNVALVTATTGTCAGASCYVPLPNDADEGWVVSSGTVQLAPGVCQKLGPAVSLAVSAGTCASESLSEPVCEPSYFDASTPDATPPEASSGDAQAEAADTGASVPDATVDGGSDAPDDAPAEAAVDATVGMVDAPAEGGPTCVAVETLCSGTCVDTRTSPTNCGACGVSCSGTCALGRCTVTIFSESDVPYAVAIDGTNVYWNDLGHGAVMKRPKTGGPAVTLATAPFMSNQPDLAVDTTNVYYGNLDTIMAVPLDGGAPVILVNQGVQPIAWASDGANLYWTGSLSCPSDGGACDDIVVSQPIDGGTAVTLAEGPYAPVAIAVNASGVYWANQGTPYLYADGYITSVPLDGGAPTTIATAQSDPSGIAVDGTNVYFTSGAHAPNGTVNGGSVVQVPIDGGTPMTLASNLSEPSGITVDGTNVYFTTLNGGFAGGIQSVPIDGGTTSTISSAAGALPYSVAVDSNSVYWAGGSNVEQAPKIGGGSFTVFAGISSADSLALSGGNVYVAYGSGGIVSVPTTGGAATTLVSGLSTQPQGLVANATGLAWSGWPSEVDTMSLDGGSRVLVASVMSNAPAIDSNSVFWLNKATGLVQFAPIDGGGPVQPIAVGFNSNSVTTGITVDSNNVYFALGGTADGGYANGEVIQVARVGGTPTTLASGLTAPAGIAVAGNAVYWADSRGVLSVAIDGGVATTVASDTQTVSNVFVDGTNVYWSDNSTIQRASIDGGAPVTVVGSTSVYGPLNSLVVDTTSVYWTEGGNGAVKKVTPK